MNLVQNLRHRAELQPGVPAIVDRTVRGDRVVSFVAFNRSVDFLALRLREEGVKSGHQVLLALDPSQEFYLFALALLQIGAIPVICRKALGTSFLTEWVKNVQPQACVIPQSRWLTQHFHRQLRLIPRRLFVHAFRFESRWLRLGRFGQPLELNRDQIAWIELRSESPDTFRAWAWNQETLARTTQRLVSRVSESIPSLQYFTAAESICIGRSADFRRCRVFLGLPPTRQHRAAIWARSPAGELHIKGVSIPRRRPLGWQLF